MIDEVWDIIVKQPGTLVPGRWVHPGLAQEIFARFGDATHRFQDRKPNTKDTLAEILSEYTPEQIRQALAEQTEYRRSRTAEYRLVQLEKIAGAECPRKVRRRPANSPYHDEAYLAARQLVLRAQPVCQLCHSAPSTEVDHVNSDSRNNSLPNLRGLCVRCNRSKAVTLDGGGNHTPEHLERMRLAREVRRINCLFDKWRVNRYALREAMVRYRLDMFTAEERGGRGRSLDKRAVVIFGKGQRYHLCGDSIPNWVGEIVVGRWVKGRGTGAGPMRKAGREAGRLNRLPPAAWRCIL